MLRNAMSQKVAECYLCSLAVKGDLHQKENLWLQRIINLPSMELYGINGMWI